MNTPDKSIDSKYTRPRLKLRRLLFYLISLSVIIVIYIKFSEVKEMKKVFERSDLYWLFIAGGLQALTYYFTALNYRTVLRMKGLTVSAKELYPVSLIVLFLNQALPSAGVSGQIFFIDYLRKRGLAVLDGIGRAILEISTLYSAFGIMFIVSVILLFRGGQFETHPSLKVFIYSFILVATLALMIFFALQRRGRGQFTGWIIRNFQHRFGDSKNGNNGLLGNIKFFFNELHKNLNLRSLGTSGELFGLAIFYQLLVFGLDAATLYVLALALGFNLTWPTAIIAFSLTQFASMISFMPGALGIFEGGMTLVLITFGIKGGQALSVTLLLRALIFWLPMPIGWLLYRKYSRADAKTVV